MTGFHKKHALVVGGTGMLRGVSLELARQGYTVSVIARNKNSLESLIVEARQSSGTIVALEVDYQNYKQLRLCIQNSVNHHGAISLAVVWIHNIASPAIDVIANLVGGPQEKSKFFHIRGSSNLSELKKLRKKSSEEYRTFTNLNYYEIILGYINANFGFRWLTHDEISQGVLTAIAQSQESYVVGHIDENKLIK